MCPMPARAASAWRAPTRSASSFPTSTASSSPKSCAAWTAKRAAAATCYCCRTCIAGSEQSANAMRAMRGRVDGLIVLAPHLSEDELVERLPAGTPAVLHQHARRCRRLIPASGSTMPRARAQSQSISWLSGASGSCTLPGRRATSTRRNARTAFRARARDAGRLVRRDRCRATSARSRAKQRSRQCSNPATTFDAVFAANDMMAIGALQALRPAGRPRSRGCRGGRLRRYPAGAAHWPDHRPRSHRRAWRARDRPPRSPCSRRGQMPTARNSTCPKLVIRSTTDPEAP